MRSTEKPILTDGLFAFWSISGRFVKRPFVHLSTSASKILFDRPIKIRPAALKKACFAGLIDRAEGPPAIHHTLPSLFRSFNAASEALPMQKRSIKSCDHDYFSNCQNPVASRGDTKSSLPIPNASGSKSPSAPPRSLSFFIT